ncbi:CocE/NonD family hydrolase [Candidatus Palauibacter sp.]|uniref:CocE/NonD family hydrolase n=1 Tax=Candidatus Palauibacter sp. TaxID=3101350 RepID=UPI003AF29E97
MTSWIPGGRADAPEAAALTGVRLLHGLRGRVRDGVRLSADVYVPASGGPFPTIVTRTPYESGRDAFIENGIWWAQRGYAFVVQDCRGRFESEGVFHAYVPEIEDGHDTLEWVAGQAWCDGKIGMWGRSYGGLTQWLSAPLGSPHLTCMAPHVICDDHFGDCHYLGGAFQLLLSLGAAVIWETNLAAVTGPHAAHLFQNANFWAHLPLIEMDERAIGRKIPYWREWLEHPTRDDYWRPLSVTDRYHQVSAPVFQQGGWYDAYPGSCLRIQEGMAKEAATARAREQSRSLIGPWSHEIPEKTTVGDVEFGPDAWVDVREEERRWFDWQLRGRDDGISEDPPVRWFTTGANRWCSGAEWPPPDTETVRWYLRSHGRANRDDGARLGREPPADEPPDRFDYDPRDPAPSLGGNLSSRLITTHAETPMRGGPVEQAPIERRPDVLVYTSRELQRDLEVTGPIDLVLYAESSARDTDFVARLTDVDRAGRSFVLTEGILRARYRGGLSRTDLLEPNVVAEFRIQLYPMSHVFRAAHCIRLQITSSCFPRFSRNLNTGEDVGTGTRMRTARNTVLHTAAYPSHLRLRVAARPRDRA